MGDFMLPSQPLAKWQHGIHHFFTHLSGMTTTIRRYVASQQMRWHQKITGQVFVLTLWNVSTTGPCRLRELQCNCQWIPINFQQLTYIGRCRKLERENDSAAAQGRHTNKKTCNAPAVFTTASTHKSRYTAILNEAMGRKPHNTPVATGPRLRTSQGSGWYACSKFYVGFLSPFLQIMRQALLKYTGLKTLIFTPFIIINTMLCSVYSWQHFVQ
jgi:hypothetical protein